MENLENQVQKYIVNLCKYLPNHVDKWRSAIEAAVKPIQNLQNLVEQMACVNKAELEYIENFDDIKQTIKYQISCRIEEDLTILKAIIDDLNKSNHDLKNKTFLLERTTLDLDWESGSSLLRGTAIQPPLSRLMEYALEFLNFFTMHSKEINDNFKTFRPNNKDSVDKLQDSFKFSLEDTKINYILAITRYIDNDKLLT